MLMQVIFETCTGRFAKVDADIEALRRHHFEQHLDGAGGKNGHLQIFIKREIGKVGDMAIRGNH